MIRTLLLVVLLSGCAARATLMPLPDAMDVPIKTVHVTSQRGVDIATGAPNSERSQTAAFQSYDITLPEGRPTGTVSFPKGQADPAVDMLVAARRDLGSAAAFRAEVRRALGTSTENGVLLYVHGYNNTFADGVLRAAQIAEDFAFEGVVTHYAWPSAGHPLAYVFDRDSVMASRASLQRMIEDLATLGSDNFTIVAHSVGADLLMEVLRDLAISGRGGILRKIDGVVLISPDIDVDVFRTQAMRIGKLPQPFIVITSPNDRALTVSARLTGQVSRVGSLDDPGDLSAFEIVFVDVSALSGGGDFLRHFTAATSPEAIRLIRQLGQASASLGSDNALRPGLFPGSVIRARQATRIILGQP